MLGQSAIVGEISMEGVEGLDNILAQNYEPITDPTMGTGRPDQAPTETFDDLYERVLAEAEGSLVSGQKKESVVFTKPQPDKFTDSNMNNLAQQSTRLTKAQTIKDRATREMLENNQNTKKDYLTDRSNSYSEHSDISSNASGRSGMSQRSAGSHRSTGSHKSETSNISERTRSQPAPVPTPRSSRLDYSSSSPDKSHNMSVEYTESFEQSSTTRRKPPEDDDDSIEEFIEANDTREDDLDTESI